MTLCMVHIWCFDNRNNAVRTVAWTQTQAQYLTHDSLCSAQLSVGKGFIFAKLTLSNSYAAQGQICIAIVIFQSVIAECEILMRLFPSLSPYVSFSLSFSGSLHLSHFFFLLSLSLSLSIQNLKQISPLYNRIHYCLNVALKKLQSWPGLHTPA